MQQYLKKIKRVSVFTACQQLLPAIGCQDLQQTKSDKTPDTGPRLPLSAALPAGALPLN